MLIFNYYLNGITGFNSIGLYALSKHIRSSETGIYQATKEYQLLREKLKKGEEQLHDSWSEISNDLQAAFPGRVTALPTTTEDRCYKAKINLKWAALKVERGDNITCKS